jgi:SPP1 gp7 family putative phage head morphogenesis protein
MITGASPDKAISAIAKKFNVSKSNAARLIHTEAAYFANAADKAAYAELGVEEFEIVGTLDGKTCKICGGLDGKHLPLPQFEAGVTAPPFHPRCRCTTAPYFEDEAEYDGSRFARGEDGKAYYVPQDMTYKDWKEKFVDGGDKSGLKPIDNDGVVSWVKDIPVVPDPPKKEYLTKKKLQANIADIDKQMKDLEAKTGGDVFNGGTADDMQAYVDLQTQKAEFEEMLQKKLIAEQKKALTKQQMTLQAEFDTLQGEVKTYSGIWKDDVTTADWKSKAASIQAKKDYFQSKIDAGGLTDEEKAKFEQFIKNLDEFDTEGKHYQDVLQQLNKIKNSLTNLNKNATILSADNAFSQARKDAALWAKTPQEADKKLRDVCGEVWRNASSAEKDAIFRYTSNYGVFNRPLSGFEKPWAMSGSGYESQYFKGVNKVWIDYEGAGKQIREMTDIISKSSYDFDAWVQRGVDDSAMESFFNLPFGDLSGMSKAELDGLVGRSNRIWGFVSTADAKGAGFSHKHVIMNIYAPKGTQMMYAEPFSDFGSGAKRSWDGVTGQTSFGGEAEVIIQRGASYTVTKVEKTGGKIYIDLELHTENGYDLIQQDPAEWTGSTKRYK